MGEASKVLVAATTRDGRLVYLSAVAKPQQPGLDEALASLLKSLAYHSYEELQGDRVLLEAKKALSSQGFKVEDLELSVSFRCPSCGASINFSPETVVYVCPYCGWSGDVYGRELRVKAWPPGGREKLEEIVRGLGGVLHDAVLRYVPFWVFKVKVEGSYAGTATYTVTRTEYVTVIHEGRPRQIPTTRTEVRRKKVAGRVSFSTVKGVGARVLAEVFGGEGLKRWVEYEWENNPPPELSAEQVKPVAQSFLSAEVDAGEALGIARREIDSEIYAEIERSARRQVEGSLKEVAVESLSVDLKVVEKSLVFVPYWFFTYKVEGNLYAGAVAGPKATLLKAERRISNIERAARLAGAWIAVLASGALAQVSVGSDLGFPGVLMAWAIGLVGAYKLAESAFAPAEVVA
ncbi:TFIIB-type zinc ribbon-containing protein [Thermofilum pendens]|uniref:Zinc ribbon domain-containing protein n=1 Tax=Thermofilum pendens (strain DSM 2475 / Hrk 5) TaxID=368408 RepID=A1RZ02_THEPD|nr:hypothetical protein [Thermofilum pendens]ABL78432.1 hypothetical protein Tpen_1032 [Thermofilum pendens Hrk 5]